MVITRQVGRSMATQLDRVNSDTLEDLRQKLQEAEQTIMKLRRRLADYTEADVPIPSKGYIETRTGRYLDGQKVYSIYEAANLCRPRVSYDVAYRYIRDGYWTAEQNPENRVWYVHATNQFVKRPHKSPDRRKR